MSNRTDRALRVLTGLTVAALATVAGAISFAHMTELAIHHDQTGWKAYAFPVSVDGLEIVASLYLVVQRRAGRPTGWVPWLALVVGTLASLAANIAVGGHDPIGKALAGWPALSMLASVKLLFSMIDHSEVDQRTVPDDQRLSADRPAVPETVPDDGPASRTVDLPSAVIAAGVRAGLVPTERCVALLAALRDGHLVARPSFFQLQAVRKARTAGTPMHLIAHEDVLIFTRPPVADGEGRG